MILSGFESTCAECHSGQIADDHMPINLRMPGTVFMTINLEELRDSDPATGLFSFSGEALVGPWGVQVATPFYPVVLTQSGLTTSVDPNVTNLVFQFPPDQEVNGRLVGRIFMPDGTLAGADLDMISAVRFMTEILGINIEETLRMASLYPAQVIKREAEIGQLIGGARADFILLDEALNIRSVWRAGSKAHDETPSGTIS